MLARSWRNERSQSWAAAKGEDEDEVEDGGSHQQIPTILGALSDGVRVVLAT